MEVTDSKRVIMELVETYFGKNELEDDLRIYTEFCGYIQRVVFNFSLYEDDFGVYRNGDKFLVDIKGTEYSLEVKLELCHLNVENIHYKINEVVILTEDKETLIVDSDGYIDVRTVEEEIEMV